MLPAFLMRFCSFAIFTDVAALAELAALVVIFAASVGVAVDTVRLTIFEEVRNVGRKNRRNTDEYRNNLGFDPGKYIQSRHSSKTGSQLSLRTGSQPGTPSDSQSQPSCSEQKPTYLRSSQEEERRSYRIPHRGEVWFADLGCHPGTSVQDGCRPVFIVSNNKGNRYASTIVVVPMTTRLKKCGLPSHVELRQEDLTKIDVNRPMEDSLLMAEQITTIGKLALCSYLGKVEDPGKLAEIDRAVKIQLGMES